ncbi:YopX family protein [Psychrobacillus sp. FSL K6-2365]|uniref:YopX family protein n=1 Tax=Psychrobacillus sp. FSL K6-2365 TaxID=2921546 RepID=UPI0030F74EE9
MREVKFRGRRINDGEWVYGFPHTIDTVDEGYTGRAIQTHFLSGRPISYQIDKETLSEFTGLKDKNGTEIFEGDIVLVENFVVETIKPFKAVIEWDKTRFALNELGSLNISNYPAITPNGVFGPFNNLSDFGQSFEVIGNIYEHPELLGDSQ